MSNGDGGLVVRVIGIYDDIVMESRMECDAQGRRVREIVTRIIMHEVPREVYVVDRDTGELRADWVDWAEDMLTNADAQDVDLDEEKSEGMLFAAPWARAYVDGPQALLAELLREEPPMTHLRGWHGG